MVPCVLWVLILICAGVWFIGLTSIWTSLYDGGVEEVEAEDEEAWTCEYCGTEVHATTVEGFVEGLRIHSTAIYCPGDEDDDEEYYW